MLSIEGTGGNKTISWEYEDLRNLTISMLRVIGMHRVCIRKIQRTKQNSPEKSDHRGRGGTEK